MTPVSRSSASPWQGNKKSQTLFGAFGNLAKCLRLKRLGSFDNFSGLDAPGADLHAAVAARGQLDADRLKVRLEPTTRLVVRV